MGRLGLVKVVGLCIVRPPSGGMDDAEEMLLMAEEANGVDAAGSPMAGAEGAWVSCGRMLLPDCWHSVDSRAL